MRTGAGVNFPEGSAADSSLWPHHRQASPPPGELLLWERGPRTSGKSSHAVPSVWVSCLPQAGGEALPLSWCLALRQEDPEMPSPHVWPAVMAAGLGPAGRLAGHAHAGSRGLHTAAGSACEHVRRWKTPGSDDPAPEVVQCEPCGFLLVRDLLVQTRLQRAYSRVIVSVAAQGRPQTANCPPVTAPPSSGTSSGAWPPPQLRFILRVGAPPQFRVILGGVASAPVQAHPRGRGLHPSSGSSSGVGAPPQFRILLGEGLRPRSGSSLGAWPPPQFRFILGEGAPPQFGFILGGGGSALV
ncbi:uncharacterized protein LOC113890944 isoform X2 [Bos indicus x Bos taurus]|uniref:uncharacterized protein LOC113890944 isoform X2 n=1 Tax=Bos indicus x Bos taurus TaxID=30522 RepID=UPI000F7D4DF0|nr:uncharacterized protein LOC113890944 isoform X2 [Bos indicus x Bos taurus]